MAASKPVIAEVFTSVLILCCLICLTAGQCPAGSRYSMQTSFQAELQGHPFENSRYVTIQGTELHFRYWASGTGQSRGYCLLIHGFSGSTFSWETVAEYMQSEGYDVVALDIPPFGYSDKSPRTNQSVTARAQLVHAFLSQVFPERAWHVAGHSMGGAIAQAMALMNPESISSLTFVAGALFSRIRSVEVSQAGDPEILYEPDSIARAPSEATTPDVSRGAGILTAWPVRNIAGRLAENFFITPRRIRGLLESAYGRSPSREQVRGYLDPLKMRGTATAILASRRESSEIVSLSAADLKVPALAIWGSDDRWVPMESRKNILEIIPEIQIQVIEGAGHNPMETHTRVFLYHWVRFIQEADIPQ
jgi:2-hydroxy-6-oxonona-2,4-dienedioate hydrolase